MNSDLKNNLMRSEKTRDFISMVQGIGYKQTPARGGSHLIFKAPDMPVLSIPCHDRRGVLSIGVRRQLTNMIIASIKK
jgi:predicted RNA binding protein YcfA (HicA-like mRNA interferase family)